VNAHMTPADYETALDAICAAYGARGITAAKIASYALLGRMLSIVEIKEAVAAREAKVKP
jgi:hypothetical protein